MRGQEPIIIKNPACYDLEPYIGRFAEYISPDEPCRVCMGHIEHDPDCGEACVHDAQEDYVYAFTGTISEIRIY